jgi:DNA-binding transcriptional LysR family regulator
LNVKLSLEALAVLDAIDRRGSFAAAAEELNRVPSAITYTVQKVEQDLAVAIFDRSGHRAVLTAAGRELLEEGRHLLRAAAELEARVKRVATGWEAELRIAVDHLIPLGNVFPLLTELYHQECGTRLHLQREVYGGSWDALISCRADLAIGATGEGPPGGGYAAHPLGTLDLVFAVAPGHPLAALPEPLKREDILAHRAIAAADSSRNLSPRTAGLLSGQDVLTLPDMQTKLEAQRLGLGIGYIPRPLAEAEAAAGRLLIKRVEEAQPHAALFIAWRTEHKGKALQWFLSRLRDPMIGAHLMAWSEGLRPIESS